MANFQGNRGKAGKLRRYARMWAEEQAVPKGNPEIHTIPKTFKGARKNIHAERRAGYAYFKQLKQSQLEQQTRFAAMQHGLSPHAAQYVSLTEAGKSPRQVELDHIRNVRASEGIRQGMAFNRERYLERKRIYAERRIELDNINFVRSGERIRESASMKLDYYSYIAQGYQVDASSLSRRELRAYSQAQRMYERYRSPTEYRPQYTSIAEPPVPVTDPRPSTISRVTAYETALGLQKGTPHQIIGSTVRFQTTGGKISLPLLGPVYSKSTGAPSGYQGAVNVIEYGPSGTAVVANVHDKLIGELKMFRNTGDYARLREGVEQIQSLYRHRSVRPFRDANYHLTNPIEMMHAHQFNWQHTRDPSGNPVGISIRALREQGQGTIKPTQFSEIVFGRDMLYGRDGTQLLPIRDMELIQQLHQPLLQYARNVTGRDLHWDPTSDASILTGRFTDYAPSALDPFANLQKRGYKFAQQFRTLPIDTQHPDISKAAHVSGHLLKGRMLRTHLERQASARASTISPNLQLGPRSPDLVTGLNVPGALMFGQHSRHLPEERSAIITPWLQRHLQTGISTPDHPVNVGISTPIFAGDFKANIIGVDPKLALGGRRVHSMRAAEFSRPAYMVHATMSAYVQAGLQKRHSWDSIQAALKQAVGPEKFMPGTPEAVLRQGIDLFSDHRTALDEATQMFRRFGAALGVSPDDLVTRDAQGRIMGMLINEHIGVREQALEKAVSYARHGLTLGSGQKIALNYASIARGVGAPLLSEYFTDVRRNPTLQGALKFRQQVVGNLGHLIDPNLKLRVTSPLESVKLSDLQTALSPHSSAVKDLLSTYKHSGYAGLADALRSSDFIKGTPLEKLFDSAAGGFYLDMGAKTAYAGSLDISGSKLGLSGEFDRIPIPALQHTNIKDAIAADILRLSRGGAEKTGARNLITNLLQQYVGGKGSLISHLASPSIGSELISTVQKPIGIGSGEYKALVKEYLDNLVAGGRLTPEQYAQFDLDKHRYAFVSGHRAKDLSEYHRTLLDEQGFLRSLAVRDPIKGRMMAMRMFFAEEQYLPAKLRGLLGTEGVVTGLGDVEFLEGDTDFDRIRKMIAEYAPGDPATHKLKQGFQQLERAQAAMMFKLDDVITRELADPSGVRAGTQSKTEAFLDLIAGRGGKDQAGLKQFFTLTPQAQLDSLAGAAGVKQLTGFSYSPAVQRQLALEAMSTAKGSVSPFTNLSNIEKYYLQDFLPGMQQMFISKHSVAGKTSLALINDMTEVIHRTALERAKGQRSSTAEDAANEARRLLTDLITEIHTTAGKEVKLAHSLWQADELFGLTPAQLSDKDLLRESLTTGKGRKLVDAVLEAEIDMAENLRWLKDSTVGDMYKDSYNLDNLQSKVRTVGAKTGLSDVQSEMVLLAGEQIDSIVDMVQSSEATIKMQEAEAFNKKVSSLKDDVFKNLTSSEVKSSWKEVKQNIINSLADPANRKPALIGGGIAAGLLALGTLGFVGRKVDQWTTPAGQESGVPGSPRTEYYVPEESMAGNQLSGIMHVPPSNMQGMLSSLNQMDSRADIRVMDTRRGLSDRVFGYQMEERANSLYSRGQI